MIILEHLSNMKKSVWRGDFKKIAIEDGRFTPREGGGLQQKKLKEGSATQGKESCLVGG